MQEYYPKFNTISTLKRDTKYDTIIQSNDLAVATAGV